MKVKRIEKDDKRDIRDILREAGFDMRRDFDVKVDHVTKELICSQEEVQKKKRRSKS